MQAAVSFFVLCALAATGVAVGLQADLGNVGAPLIHAISLSDTRNVYSLQSEQERRIPRSILHNIGEDEEMLARLTEPWQEQVVDARQFSEFIHESKCLNIRGDKAWRFARTW
jgi:hypothetical protein